MNKECIQWVNLLEDRFLLIEFKYYVSNLPLTLKIDYYNSKKIIPKTIK